MSTALAAAAATADGTTASIISILAIDGLMPSLRLAHHYVLTIAAQRYPSYILRLHRFRDEVYLILSTMLEGHSLGHHGASFAEVFYGMQRASGHSSKQDPRGNVASVAAQLAALLLPSYLRAKVETLLEADHEDGDDYLRRSFARLPPRVREAVSLLCRAVCALCDGGNLVALLLFVHGRSKHATLAQWLLNFTLRRRTAQDALNQMKTSGASGSGARGNAGGRSVGSSSVETAILGLLRRIGTLLEAPLRHARQLLLLSVFSFRLLEWWHAPQNAPSPPPKLIPPPPQPPPPRTDAPLATTAGICSACRRAPREPTASPSGYVFCASCLRAAMARDRRCPVTGQPMRPEQLRRLYETSRPLPASPTPAPGIAPGSMPGSQDDPAAGTSGSVSVLT